MLGCPRLNGHNSVYFHRNALKTKKASAITTEKIVNTFT